MNNCTNPPHFPPHCGCPAGVTPDDNPDVRLLARLKKQGEELARAESEMAAVRAQYDDIELRMLIMQVRMDAQRETREAAGL